MLCPACTGRGGVGSDWCVHCNATGVLAVKLPPTPMTVVYICHPLRGKTQAETEANRARASEITAELTAYHKVIAPVCSWIVLSQHWTEEQGRELGLKIDCALIERCDQLWQCGPLKDPSEGMAIEIAHAHKHGVQVVDQRGRY